MRTIETLRAEPVPTTDRVVAAWADAHPVVRRAVVAACAISAALSTAIQASTSLRWSIAVVGAVLAIAAMVDVYERKLPNRLLLGALAVVAGGVCGAGSTIVIVSAVLGLVIAGGLMLLVRMTRGVGMGDVKMAGVIGASVGAIDLMAAPVAVAIAAFVAALFGLLRRRRRLPLGPFLWLGWVASLVLCSAGWMV